MSPSFSCQSKISTSKMTRRHRGACWLHKCLTFKIRKGAASWVREWHGFLEEWHLCLRCFICEMWAAKFWKDRMVFNVIALAAYLFLVVRLSFSGGWHSRLLSRWCTVVGLISFGNGKIWWHLVGDGFTLIQGFDSSLIGGLEPSFI